MVNKDKASVVCNVSKECRAFESEVGGGGGYRGQIDLGAKLEGSLDNPSEFFFITINRKHFND